MLEEPKTMMDSCCCRIFAIVIYNSNAITDDNFKILVNGIDIGHIDNNSDTITGRIFADHNDFTPSMIASPSSNNFEATIVLDLTTLGLSSSNTLRVESIQNNAHGNAGLVRVGYWLKNLAGKYALQSPVLLDTDYSFTSGVGNGQDFTFTYP